MFKRLVGKIRPSVVISRHRLHDGHSDDVVAVLRETGFYGSTKLIVLIPADSPSLLEARQIALGADLVQRDPVRMDVLVQYLRKFRASAKIGESHGPELKPFEFAGGWVHRVERKLEVKTAKIHLTPREVELAELLVQSTGKVVTYEMLYNEILGRRFTGETSNLRVLLGKLTITTRALGIDLRRWVEVIPKLGYRYRNIART